MKKRTWLKLGSAFLALVMCVSTFGGLFITAAETAMPVVGSDGSITMSNPLGDVVPGEGAGATAPTAPTDGYDVWDGTSDTSWYSEEETTFYLDTAEKLAGLMDLVDAMAVTNKEAWVTAAEAALTAAETVPNSKDYVHVMSGKTFYITANIDLNGIAWDGIGTHDQWVLFQGSIEGALGGTVGEMVYIKGLNAVYNSAEDIGKVTLSDGKTTSVTNGNIGDIQGVGFVTTRSGGNMKNMTLVDPVATVAIANTGFFTGKTRSSGGMVYENLHVINGTMNTSAAKNTIGGIVGEINSNLTVQNCTVAMTLNYTSGSPVFGGLAGKISATGAKLLNSTATATVTTTGNTNSFGGVVGQISYAGGNATTAGVNIENCVANLTCNQPTYQITKLGGIAFCGSQSGDDNKALANYVKINNCVANMDIHSYGTNDMLIGGAAPYLSGNGFLTVENTLVTGLIKIYGSGSQIAMEGVGGILGRVQTYGAKIHKCQVTADIEIAADGGSTRATFYRSGGIVGVEENSMVASGSLTIDGCVFSGSIKATGKGGQLQEIGGIMGKVQRPSTIQNCLVGKINSDGTISRVTISTVDTANTGHGCQIAGIVGHALDAQTITDCQAAVNFDFKGGSTSGEFEQTAGVVGLTEGSHAVPMANCKVDMVLTVSDGANYNGARLYQSGGLVGRNNGALTITNAEVKLVVNENGVTDTANNSDTMAGVVGYAPGALTITGAKVDFEHNFNHLYTGSVSAYGGVVGKTNNASGTYNITDCVVNYNLDAAKQADANKAITAVGGIVGVGQSGTLNIDNCFVQGKILKPGKQSGGIVGASYAANTLSITNSQSEIVVAGAGTQAGAVLGRLEGTLTLENVLLTGMAGSNDTQYHHAFAWVGLVAAQFDGDITDADGTVTNTITMNNLWSNSKIPVFGGNDALETDGTRNLYKIVLNGAEVPVTYYSDTDLLDTESFTGAFSAVDVDTVTLDAAMWTTYEDGKTNPLLKIAEDVDRPYGTADLSWFDPLTQTTWEVKGTGELGSNLEAREYDLDSKEKVLGWAMLTWIPRFYDAFDKWVAQHIEKDCYLPDMSLVNMADINHSSLNNGLPGYYATWVRTGGDTPDSDELTQVAPKELKLCAHDHVNDVCTGGTVTISSLNIFKQMTKGYNTGYYDEDTLEWVDGDQYAALRLIAGIEELQGFYEVGFEITNATGQTYTTTGMKTVYKAFTTAGNWNAASVDNPTTCTYMFALDVTDIPVDTAGELTVRAFVRYGSVEDGDANEGIAYGNAETFNVKTLYTVCGW